MPLSRTRSRSSPVLPAPLYTCAPVKQCAFTVPRKGDVTNSIPYPTIDVVAVFSWERTHNQRTASRIWHVAMTDPPEPANTQEGIRGSGDRTTPPPPSYMPDVPLPTCQMSPNRARHTHSANTEGVLWGVFRYPPGRRPTQRGAANAVMFDGRRLCSKYYCGNCIARTYTPFLRRPPRVPTP